MTQVDQFAAFKAAYREQTGEDFGGVAVEKYVHNDLIQKAHAHHKAASLYRT
jgi:hypothetical protein